MTKRDKNSITELENAHRTINSGTSDPQAMISAYELVLRTFRATRSKLSRALKRYTAAVVDLEAAGVNTRDGVDSAVACFANLVELGTQIAGLEAGLIWWRSRVKQA